tara:strand:- start:2132 stop:3289 length:1158 start_codon:yes stop_codon:yes gene_type:complete
MCSTEIESWNDECINIKENLLRGIFSYGFEKPSPIQQKAIVPCLSGKDIIAQAQSGTGKTGAFSISALQRVDESINDNQILIMSPTRELSQQIHGVISSIGTFIDNLNIKLLIGGSSIETDMRELEKNNNQIIVGCPGRIHDMIRRKKINMKTIKMIILDEADEMLSSGFKEQVYNIFHHSNINVQICLFSATLPEEIQSLTNKFMKDPQRILVKADQLTLEGIRQYFIALENDSMKFETIKELFSTISMSQCLIYCNSIKRVSDLYEAMIAEGFSVSCLHSNMDKEARTNAYKEFKCGSTRVLISSNVTARGIDVQQVSTVINFDVPNDVHLYIHRIGRSGRWGRKGCGINFVTRRDIKKIKDIEAFYNTQIDELPNNFANVSY